jgi:hypothetical protein
MYIHVHVHVQRAVGHYISKRLHERVGLQNAGHEARIRAAICLGLPPGAPDQVRERQLGGFCLACTTLPPDDERLRSAAMDGATEAILHDRIHVWWRVYKRRRLECGHHILTIQRPDELVRIYGKQNRAHEGVDLVPREAHHRVLHDGFLRERQQLCDIVDSSLRVAPAGRLSHDAPDQPVRHARRQARSAAASRVRFQK